MRRTKGNGLTACNSQPAENHNLKTQPDFNADGPNEQPEQLALFDAPDFMPLLPGRGTAAEKCLFDLIERDLTQPDWLKEGKGWRLAAAVKELDYLGWRPKSIRVKCNARTIARYSLSARAKKAAYALLNSEAGHAHQ